MTRHLIVVFGDQLDPSSAAFDGFDNAKDAVLMMEVAEEATYIRQHRLRIAYFFAAMRAYAHTLEQAGRTVHYIKLDAQANTGAFATEIPRHVTRLKPDRLIAVEPGDWRVRQTVDALGLPLEWREDRHFLCTTAEFAAFLKLHPRPVMETFYRQMRRTLRILLDGKNPVGGTWNYDAENRERLGRDAPPIPPLPTFPEDQTTRAVITLVNKRFTDSPGRLTTMELPTTTAQAQEWLHHFVRHRLPHFGRYQDAMKTGEPFLFHARLSAPINLHLLHPREVVDAALANPSDAPLNAVEGFVRQIIGWREWVRGIYWAHMPGYAEENTLHAHLPMPAFYWTGETDMRCLADAIAHTIDHAYAHHIERLMVLGLYALLLGVNPLAVHEWHMSMFADAIDWVSLPNAAGMGQHSDGGKVGTKPYVASGAYINRMSNHCGKCRYDPTKSVGDDACPFTTLYWDFLARHEQRFRHNGRMRNMYANFDRKDADTMHAIRARAEMLRHTA